MLGGCYNCFQGVKHRHAGFWEVGTMEKLLTRWLDWSEQWGDRDMLQALQAETRVLLGQPCKPVASIHDVLSPTWDEGGEG